MNWDELVLLLYFEKGSSLNVASVLLPDMVGDCVRRPLVTTFDHLCPPDNFAFVLGECDGVGWFISIPMFFLFFFNCKFFDPN